MPHNGFCRAILKADAQRFRIQYDECMAITRTTKAGKGSNSSPVLACPVEKAIHVIGGKWKLLLLRSLLLNGPQTYNQLLRSVTGISSKELTRNLGELVASGLLTRVADGSAGTSRYAPTRLGKGLMPAFKCLLTWGQKLLPKDSTNISVR
jgi:DNA-binding HxlR family transcriptional regulator